MIGQTKFFPATGKPTPIGTIITKHFASTRLMITHNLFETLETTNGPKFDSMANNFWDFFRFFYVWNQKPPFECYLCDSIRMLFTLLWCVIQMRHIFLSRTFYTRKNKNNHYGNISWWRGIKFLEMEFLCRIKWTLPKIKCISDAIASTDKHLSGENMIFASFSLLLYW